MELYIYEKLPFFCDKLIQLIDDGTIMDLVLLLLSQPKEFSCAQIESQSIVPQAEMDQHDKSYEDHQKKEKYDFMKKKGIIEGLFDNLTSQKFNQEIQIEGSADAQTLEEKQRRMSKNFNEQICDSQTIFWKMKNSSMILCEILDRFQDIKGGEDLGFVILNYHSKQIFQSLSSNNVDEISFSCDVAQHLLAFLQNEDIQFQIEFEKIKGNKIVEKYFKDSISSIKKELMTAQQKKIDSFQGQFGEKIGMLSAYRLKLIKLIELAFSFKIKEVVQEIFEQDVLQIIIVKFNINRNNIKKALYSLKYRFYFSSMSGITSCIQMSCIYLKLLLKQLNKMIILLGYFIKSKITINIQDNKESQNNQSVRRIINPTTKQYQVIQKSYIGHLKKIAETLMKCLEQNFQYQAWIEDLSKWTELTELVMKQQKLLKGKLGEEEEKKQKFQLNNCKGKQSLLNRRKQLVNSKKEQSSDNNSGNNTEVFNRLNSPIKKTITLQVGTPKQSNRRITEDDEDEQRESVSSLKSKKELQLVQQQKQFSIDSPMLKSRNSTPLLSSNSSLANQQLNQQLGLRTPKTPILSTPTRTSSNTPQTPNMKKLLINSPLQKNHIHPENMLLIKDKFDLNNSSKDTSQNHQTKESLLQKNSRKRSNSYSRSNGSSFDGNDFDYNSNSSISSIDSTQSRSSSLDNSQEQRMKTKEIHNQLLKNLDNSFGEDETKNFTYKHLIKIDDFGLQYFNKKQKILFDWNQNAEDEEEEQKILSRQEEEEKNKKILSEQVVNQSSSTLSLFNLDSTQVMYQRQLCTNNNNQLKLNNQYQNLIKESKHTSPNISTQNLNNLNENHKINSNDEFSSPQIYPKGSPYIFGYNSNMSNFALNSGIKRSFKKKIFKQESPCIQVNKQYFRYLIKDTIRKYSYDHQLDQKTKPTPSQFSQVRSCPQNNTFKSLFNLEESNKEHLRKLIPIKHIEKTRDGRLSFESISNRLNISSSKENNNCEGIPRSMESLSYLRSSNQSTKVNSKLVKQVRDILDISDGSSHNLAWKSNTNFDDHRTPSKIILEKTIKEIGDLSQSDISSEDEKEKLQQREKLYERKNVKKKSTFYQQQKQNITKTEQLKLELKIVEEVHFGSSLQVNDQNEQNNKTTPYNKTMFTKQNSQEKALNQLIKAKVKNMNIENESEKDSYGDLEDYSPKTKKSIQQLSKKNINSDKLIKNHSNKNISSSEEGTEKKLKGGSHLISSATSIQNKAENVKSEDSENRSILSKDDQIFINLISGDEDSKSSKNSSKQITIVNTIIQRNMEKKRSYFSQSLLEKPYYQLQSQNMKQKGIEGNFDDPTHLNLERLSRKNSFSSNSLSISKQNNQLSHNNLPTINSENSLQNSLKISNNGQPSLDKIPPFYSKTHIENITNEKDQDLILKILLRQDNSTSANSEILRSLDDKSHSEISQKDISQENMCYSQSAVINEQIS